MSPTAMILACTVSAGAGALIVAAAYYAQPDLVLFTSPSGTPRTSTTGGPDYPDYRAMFYTHLRPGGMAHDFTLEELATGREVRLSDFRGHRPVVLIFASSSSDCFCEQAYRLEELYQGYRDRAEFLFIHIREARVYPSTRPTGDHRAQVRQAMASLKLTLPCLLDTRYDETEKQFSGWPQRLVIVGIDGRIALDAGRGLPGGWDLAEVEAWLKKQTP
jgi:hypothetical protein